MHIVAIDNQIERLRELENALHDSFPDDEILAYCDPLMALKHLFIHGGNIVITEMNLQPFDGRAIAEFVHKQCGDIEVYCITDKEFTDDNDFTGCITRPVNEMKIKDIVQTAKERLCKYGKHPL